MEQRQQEITVGDKVKLNSGSPEMVVRAVTTQIEAEWRDGERLVRGSFPAPCIQRISN